MNSDINIEKFRQLVVNCEDGQLFIKEFSQIITSGVLKSVEVGNYEWLAKLIADQVEIKYKTPCNIEQAHFLQTTNSDMVHGCLVLNLNGEMLRAVTVLLENEKIITTYIANSDGNFGFFKIETNALNNENQNNEFQIH